MVERLRSILDRRIQAASYDFIIRPAKARCASVGQLFELLVVDVAIKDRFAEIPLLPCHVMSAEQSGPVAHRSAVIFQSRVDTTRSSTAVDQ